MDPNYTLARLRNLQSRLNKTSNPDAAGEVALDIAVLAGKLDAWLSNGGELPDDWKPKEREIVDAILEDDH